jgi:pyruvate/2-oxoglutarate dehydrogenase complex dihydrolipoamide acyltransferase (E2) component/tRNA A37 threonylcarbamoyladenosine synthetase subunit TsaC/SUA5/YrdC
VPHALQVWNESVDAYSRSLELVISGDWLMKLLAEDGDALRLAVDALRAGQTVAVKGLGGFHLMVDAGNAAAVERLRRSKPRRDKPFALMVRDLAAARRLVEVDEQAAALLTSAEAPIVLLPRRADAPVAATVAPGNPMLGVMLAYTPLHHLLLDVLARSETGQSGETADALARSETGQSGEAADVLARSETGQSGARVEALVATSGNLSDEPICTDEVEAVERLGHIADLFLVHDRPIERHVDDSVAWIVEGQPRLLRRARGYAPLPVLLDQPAPTILAVGAHLKNTVALSVGRQVFISQHIGDLETAEALAAFERVVADFLRLYEAEPAAIAHDMHPDYLSTRWATEEKERRETRETREEAEVEVVKVTGVRKVIAERMLASLQATAQLTLHASADARALQSLRARFKASDPAFGLQGVTINDLILLAVARTLPGHRDLNAHFQGDTLSRFEHVQLGLAVDTPAGLMVPVIRNADQLSLRQISQEAKRLVAACQARRVAPDELRGGTFTVTNLGGLGIESFTPVLNPPEVAILGVSNINLKPVLGDASLDSRRSASRVADPLSMTGSEASVAFVPHIGLSLTINHQVVDGAPAARFLQALARNLADIDLLLAG